MSLEVLIDANVALRYLLKDQEALFEEALQIMKLAQQGKIKLHLDLLTIAEMVWVLDSFYKYPRQQVAESVSAFANAEGVIVEERELIFRALSDYSACRVDFVDAYLAARARNNNWPVVTFDKNHFKRLEAELFSASPCRRITR
ncbi:MAG TPA: nucleotide-binding protein [Desulfotomaculum sp.]|nr:nucleotide-binding protein [Desulfotomaculum sp.]